MNEQQYDELVGYVIRQLQNGVDKETLVYELLQAGYDNTMTDSVFVTAQDTLYSLQRPHQVSRPQLKEAGVHKSKLEYWGANNTLFRGRLDRVSYFASISLITAILFVTGYMVIFSVALISSVADDRGYFIAMPLFFMSIMLFITVLFLLFSSFVRRLHDMGCSGKDIWSYFIPALGWLPGAKGPNEYGDDGRRLRFLQLLGLAIERQEEPRIFRYK